MNLAYLFLIVIFLAGFLYLAIKNLKWAILFILAALPLYLIRFNIGPLPTTLLECLLVISFIIWIIQYKPWKENSFFKMRKLEVG